MRVIVRFTHEITNMSRLLKKLEHCNSDDSVKLHNHSKQSKLYILGFGINRDSNQAIIVLVSSFTCKLSDWASDHVTEIYKKKTMDELINYVRFRLYIEDVERDGNKQT